MANKQFNLFNGQHEAASAADAGAGVAEPVDANLHKEMKSILETIQSNQAEESGAYRQHCITTGEYYISSGRPRRRGWEDATPCTQSLQNQVRLKQNKSN